MKLLAQLIRFFKAALQDGCVPPYPLTYDEWEDVKLRCQEQEQEQKIEKALKEELDQLPLILLAVE